MAATTAADLAQRTNSELHVVTVGADLPLYELPDHPARFEDIVREQRRQAEELLEQQAKVIEEVGLPSMRDTSEKGEPTRRSLFWPRR